MTDPEPYPDIEMALCELLQPVAGTVTQLMPNTLANGNVDPDYFPKIRIQRIGGPGDEDFDNPRVMIRCFAIPTAERPRASQDLARQVHDFMKSIHGAFAAGTAIDDASKDSGPVSRPWDDPTVRVTELIYSVSVRE